MKNFFTYQVIKTIADTALVAVPFGYVTIYVLLTLAKEELGFWGMLGVIMYGGLIIFGFSMISIIARGVLLYQHPSARTWQQKLLLSITALPALAFLLKVLVAKLLA